MSAICGAWRLRGACAPEPLCSVMLEAMAAHGPDRSACLSGDEIGIDRSVIDRSVINPSVAMGHRLLRVTAEDELEVQPVRFDAGRCLVADARIDNRAELARELGLSAAECAVLPDSGFIARAWVRWGEECLQHLLGSFAFAVWDPGREPGGGRLFLARDHAGDRPLYFHAGRERFLFATTARAIRACPGVSSELDERQLARDLIGLPPEYPRTRFREIGQIAPGHSLAGTRDDVEHRRYWAIDRLRPARFARDEDYAERFREIFDEAVRCRLRGTGEVGAELSAGLDSGAVTASAARLLAAEGRTLTAYTAVPCPEFAGPVPTGCIADEGGPAAEVAAMYPNVRHVRVDGAGSDMLRELERSFGLLDLPHAAALNAVWSDRIYDQARAAGVTVMLSGALGNFAASYTGGDILRTLFRRGRLSETVRTATRLRSMGLSSGRDAASLTVFGLLPWAVRRLVDPLVRQTNLGWSALRHDRARQYGALDQFRRYQFLSGGRLPRLMSTQFQNNQYGDYNAAALAGWHIDVRDPTADKRVFEFCASIPAEQFVVGGQGRSLIRRAMRGRLPETTLNRRERGVQGADFYESLTRIRAELGAELERIAQSPVARKLIDVDMLRGAMEHWPADAHAAAREAGVYQSAIPRGIAAGYFIRRVEEECSSGG